MAGVLGYQGQFSTDSTFTDVDPTFLIVAPNTSHTVSNLAGNMTGHFRVRSGSGTSLTDLLYSDWSGGVSGSTAAPPAAVALDAPANFRSTGRDETSVSLAWDEVDDAASYKVQEREAGASGWANSSCGGGGNDVTDTECVASGLSEGTAYDFRVRAVPAAGDTEFDESAWTQTSDAVTTLGTSEPTSTGGGGELEITWSSEASTELVFTWNRMGDARYETVELDVDDMSSADPCENKVFGSAQVNTFFNASNPAPGQVNGVCVRVEDDESTTSYAFGVATPAEHMLDAAGETDDTARGVTTRLNWTGIAVVEDFDFVLRLVADPGRDNDISNTPTPTPANKVQAACEDGRFLAQRTATRTIMPGISHAVTTGLTPFTGYLLCVRHLNGAGKTNWIVPDALAEHHTLPAAPPAPSGTRTETPGKPGHLDVVWTVDLQNRATVPWQVSAFNVRQTGLRNASTTPRTDVCDTATTIQSSQPRQSVTPTLDGIEFSQTEYTRPKAHKADNYVFACIQAQAEDGRMGLWTIGGRVIISKKVATLSAVTGASDVTLTLTGHTQDDGTSSETWYYRANTGPHSTSCEVVGTDSVTLGVGGGNNISAGARYTYTAYGDSGCTESIDSESFTVPR